MKKLKNLLVVFILANIMLTACGGEKEKNIVSENTKDIQFSDIRTICDLLDAFEIVFDQAIIFKERSFSDLSEIEKLKIDDLKKKYKKLNDFANKSFPNAKGKEECPNYENLKNIEIYKFLE